MTSKSADFTQKNDFFFPQSSRQQPRNRPPKSEREFLQRHLGNQRKGYVVTEKDQYAQKQKDDREKYQQEMANDVQRKQQVDKTAGRTNKLLVLPDNISEDWSGSEKGHPGEHSPMSNKSGNRDPPSTTAKGQKVKRNRSGCGSPRSGSGDSPENKKRVVNLS